MCIIEELQEELHLFGESIHERKARFIGFKTTIEQLQSELIDQRGDSLTNWNKAHLNALEILKLRKAIKDALACKTGPDYWIKSEMRRILREVIK